MKRNLRPILACIIGTTLSLILVQACGGSTPSAPEERPSPVTPVQVTSVTDSSLAEYIDILAVSAYLKKSYLKANINGYVESSNIQMGQHVAKGQVLFALITKEARSIGNTINKLDPGFKFSGVSTVRAGAAGTIIQVNHQTGDYVQDGESMATISNRDGLVFLMDLPYELNQIIASNKKLQVTLPDGLKLPAIVSGTMPSVDSLTQTQRYVLKVNATKDIPEGLIARVRLIKAVHKQAQALPKSAILSNETEDEFWVMKLINDSTAIKVKIDKGIESSGAIEVLRPGFLKTDRIITSGNYGLADTAKVEIQR